MINLDVKHEGDRMQIEFKIVQKYISGLGVDLGCGTNRLSNDVLTIDQQENYDYAYADIVKSVEDLEINAAFRWKGRLYTFKDNTLDFIFSSHCLEDFEDIPGVYMNWWKKLKIGGKMILMLPDMEAGRYPKVEDPKGNPSHRTNVGKKYIIDMLDNLDIEYDMKQCDTLDHKKTCSIDFVIEKRR